MDPNLFHLDWERTIEALVGIIVLSFLVERACALLFESRWWISRFEDARVGKPPGSDESPPSGGGNSSSAGDKQVKAKAGKAATPEEQKALAGRKYPLKEFLAFVLALVVCRVWDFDAVSIIMLSERTQLVGIITTAAVVAGGSKASIALFHNVLRVRSRADEERKKLRGQ